MSQNTTKVIFDVIFPKASKKSECYETFLLAAYEVAWYFTQKKSVHIYKVPQSSACAPRSEMLGNGRYYENTI